MSSIQFIPFAALIVFIREVVGVVTGANLGDQPPPRVVRKHHAGLQANVIILVDLGHEIVVLIAVLQPQHGLVLLTLEPPMIDTRHPLGRVVGVFRTHPIAINN